MSDQGYVTGEGPVVLLREVDRRLGCAMGLGAERMGRDGARPVQGPRQVFDMRVASLTPARQLAGAIAGAVREGQDVRLLMCGVSASYQAFKALATARQFLLDGGEDLRLVARVAWRTFMLDGKERTGLEIDVTALSPEACARALGWYDVQR